MRIFIHARPTPAESGSEIESWSEIKSIKEQRYAIDEVERESQVEVGSRRRTWKSAMYGVI